MVLAFHVKCRNCNRWPLLAALMESHPRPGIGLSFVFQYLYAENMPFPPTDILAVSRLADWMRSLVPNES